jgi:hypothetical protein
MSGRLQVQHLDAWPELGGLRSCELWVCDDAVYEGLDIGTREIRRAEDVQELRKNGIARRAWKLTYPTIYVRGIRRWYLTFPIVADHGR